MISKYFPKTVTIRIPVILVTIFSYKRSGKMKCSSVYKEMWNYEMLKYPFFLWGAIDLS